MALRDQPTSNNSAMQPESLAKMLQLAGTVKHLFVATADDQGTPHLAIAEHVSLEDWDLLAVTAWFCPQTAKNVQTNPAVSLVVWDRERDRGCQLIGEVEQVIEVTMQNGYIPGETVVYPQIERKLMVRVRRILDFGQAAHTDSQEL